MKEDLGNLSKDKSIELVVSLARVPLILRPEPATEPAKKGKGLGRGELPSTVGLVVCGERGGRGLLGDSVRGGGGAGSRPLTGGLSGEGGVS